MLRFELKKETNIFKKLLKIIPEETNIFNEEEILNRDFISVLDASNCLMVEAKTEQGKLILRRFIEKENVRDKGFEIDFSDKFETGTKISMEYLKPAIDFLKESDENVKIFSKKDEPLILENEHFKVFIAPRIED